MLIRITFGRASAGGVTYSISPAEGPAESSDPQAASVRSARPRVARRARDLKRCSGIAASVPDLVLRMFRAG